MTMVSIFDTAKYILEKKGQMTTWKLQKLCYYAQAWVLAWSGKPLFAEDFQAWANGPVCRELFDEHEGKHLIEHKDLTKGNSSKIIGNDLECINTILEHYGDKEPWWLREQTHSEYPWINARKGSGESERSDVIISKDDIGQFYGGL